MGSSGSPPTPPDPMQTAQAQTQMNKDTAITQYGLNATNQVTPYGNLSYDQIGKWEDGTPRYQSTTTLSPEQQNLYNLGAQTQSNLGNIGVEQSDKLRGILNTPFDLNSAIGTQQSDMQQKLLDPVWQQREQQLQSQLANQGLQQGNEGYTNALRDFGMQRDNAYNSAMLQSRGQASTEALANRNQPMNEIAALLGSSGVQQPQFTNTPQSNVANTDYLGAVNMQQSALANNYNQKVGQQNAMWGALGSIGGAALGGWGMGGFKGFGGK